MKKDKPSKDPSVFEEPHFQKRKFQLDPSETKAVENLVGDNALKDLREEELEHGVWDEPAVSEVMAGRKPEDAITYASWIREKRERTGPLKPIAVTVGIALLAGPFAVLGAIFNTQGSAFAIILIVIFAPVVEEMMKNAISLYVVEKQPWLFRSPAQILICALASGFIFAAIENLLYLNIYTRSPSAGLVQWRWTVCVALHMGCAFIMSLGLVRVWKNVWQTYERPQISLAYPYIIAAMIIHGSYNLVAVLLSAADFGF
jgi:protease prsW family protein